MVEVEGEPDGGGGGAGQPQAHAVLDRQWAGRLPRRRADIGLTSQASTDPASISSARPALSAVPSKLSPIPTNGTPR